MRGFGHGVFRYPERRGESSRNEIAVISRSRYNQATWHKPFECAHFRPQRGYLLRVLIDEHEIVAFEDFSGLRAHGLNQLRGSRTCVRRGGAELHLKPLVIACHLQAAKPRIEDDGVGLTANLRESHESARERCMIANVHLRGCGEPAQVKVLLVIDKKGRFRHAVLLRDVLQEHVGKPILERYHHRGLALKR